MSFTGTKNYHGVQPAVPIAEEPKTIADAVKHMHEHSMAMMQILERMERLADREQVTPEMHTAVINPGNNGQYEVTDVSKIRANSLGIINPGAAAVFIGIGGTSARPTSRAPTVPGAGAIVLPVHVDYDLTIGCDPAVLGASSAVVLIFRYLTVQPLLITGNI